MGISASSAQNRRPLNEAEAGTSPVTPVGRDSVCAVSADGEVLEQQKPFHARRIACIKIPSSS